MNIDTLLFDLDGTLINTNELIIASFLHTLEEYRPGEYTREHVIDFIGPPLKDSFEKVDPERVDDMIQTYRTFNHAKHDELVTEYEGVYETIKELHERGFKIAIVTTKIRKTALMGLKLTGLDQYFDVVIGLDDVEKAKPDPEPLEKALKALGSSKETAMMIGDSHFDVQAGKNLGIPTAVVGWSIKGEERIRTFEADYILSNMRDLIAIVGADQS
ncbi:pyrophosphatase PpaX [Halalkalibacter krulwichiae]|uniref:Pyrophosphatase PpaX n=1 Tax=Halalkalibacter krulwichiae TaxID=199441 RepID=A0A1X9MM04_9BACI|nr:pyrophosphatase PpaX [Halalkalibacter krulwichiae]ARK32052.1 Pyrophosphatase PpaX [Halalkalibacter krulwichiae]